MQIPLLLFVLLVSLGCNSPRPEPLATPAEPRLAAQPDTSNKPKKQPPLPADTPADSSLLDLSSAYPDFAYDLRYATPHNFLNKVIYPCASCLLRPEVARALFQANQEFIQQGFRLKIFDCYRPISVQKEMWQVMPDGRYVANPYRSGSVHNRGGAVDLSLETLDGQALDMGTDFDHFGPRAHHSYTQIPDTIRENRRLLKQGMEQHGFTALSTEWWHYNYGPSRQYPLANQPLCPNKP